MIFTHGKYIYTEGRYIGRYTRKRVTRRERYTWRDSYTRGDVYKFLCSVQSLITGYCPNHLHFLKTNKTG